MDMQSFLGTFADTVIVSLMIVAIAYGVRVSRALTRLREESDGLAASIARLDEAAGAARAAVQALRDATRDAALATARVDRAQHVADELDGLMGVAVPMVDRLEQALSEALAHSRRLEAGTPVQGDA